MAAALVQIGVEVADSLRCPTMYASLEIDGFRGFGALRLEGLGRV